MTDFELSLVENESYVTQVYIDTDTIELYLKLKFDPEENWDYIIAARILIGENLIHLVRYSYFCENEYRIIFDKAYLINDKCELKFKSLKLILFSYFNKPIVKECDLSFIDTKTNNFYTYSAPNQTVNIILPKSK